MRSRTGTGVRNTGTGAAGRNAGTFVLKADLVVVAAGRSSHLPTWLADLGLPHPRETVLDAPVGYASRLYDNPGGRWPDWVLMVEFLQAPSVRRGCFATRVEEGRFFVTLQGVGDDRPPHGDEGFAEFAGSLRAPLADVLAPLRPRTSPRTYALTGNRRLAYHRLRRWPDGLVALGDAVCVFNPVYGQGMSVAALEAALLREVLAPHARRAAALPGASPSPSPSPYASLPPGVTRRFQRRLARLTLEPWLLSTSTDWGWQQRAPALPHRMALWYLRGVLRASTTEPEVYTRFVRVLNMLSRPTALLHPRVVTKVLAGGLPTRVRTRTRVRPRARTRRRARSGTARGAGGGAEQVGPGP
ncbi:NAD(P)/FAD-dependent oxidoreductase [Streptomyces minutiscleroticus]|uniref:NAD(P)/FAD-dependent oxidoreductase n=1 Tax=Streptomyces minutiscleroticus TaxID=68238 RepID=UPI00332129DF